MMCRLFLAATLGATLVVAILLETRGQPAPVPPIQVVDGDTVRRDGKSYRLIGCDAPEISRAKCGAERLLGLAAKARVEAAVAKGAALEPRPCACRRGTEGTPACNYGRLCGTLTLDGVDVCEILIGQGLARRYQCGPTTCPRRESWCEPEDKR